MNRMNFYDDSTLSYCKTCDKETSQGYSDRVARTVCWSCVAREDREQKAFEAATFVKVKEALNLTDKEMKVLFRDFK